MSRIVLWTGVAASLGFGADADCRETTQVRSSQQDALIVVESNYPGASATVVAETVGAPIEQQVFGAESRLHVASRSGDGRYQLAVSFRTGTDLKAALAEVSRRVALAEPALPDAVRRTGVTARIKTPLLLIAVVSSSDGTHSPLQIGDTASRIVKDDLARVPGVGDLSLIGAAEQRLFVRIDPDRLAARNLTAGDALKAIEEQSPSGKSAPGNADPRKGLFDLASLEDRVVSAGPNGLVVWLKDVGRIELGAGGSSDVVRFNGRHCAALAISPTIDADVAELTRAVESKIAGLRSALPAGMRLEIAFDFGAKSGRPLEATAECLQLDLRSPEGASTENVVESLKNCEALIRESPGVAEVLASTSNPVDLFGGGPCVFVRLSPTRDRTIAFDDVVKIMRGKLESTPHRSFRLQRIPAARNRSFDLAIAGEEPEKVRALAERFAARLKKNDSTMDVSVDRGDDLIPRVEIDVDRAKAARMGVSPADVVKTIDSALGPVNVRDVEAFGRQTRIVFQVEGGFRDRNEAIKRLNVRSGNGEIVPIAALAVARTFAAPRTIDRIDLKFAVRFSAKASSAAARASWHKTFDECRRESGLSADYELIEVRR